MDDEDRLHLKRQGFWLRMAREAKGLNQLGAAQLVGLKSKSAISDYENGDTPVPQARLRRMAREYGWDLAIFTEPAPTAEEQALERMARTARAALHLAERVTAVEAEAAAHADADTPAAQPRTRSA
jgi:transcriptional regulator with XRE-family HTH domain